MKLHPFLVALSFLTFISFNVSVYAQNDMELDKTELQRFWNSNIKAIIDLNIEKIIEQTHFPLGGDWYAAYELWEASEEELQEAYTNDPGVVFDEETRNVLRQMSWEDVQGIDYEQGVVLRVPVYITFEEEGEIYEFATFFDFAQIGEDWMLIAITYAG